jgi:aryl-alcohol dehydrogenase-like predicted oxidoreductase
MDEATGMQMRTLGTSGLATPRLILGGNVFGWTVEGAEAFAILDRFVAAGGAMIDTADVYTQWITGHVGGESERLIGEWLRRRGGPKDVLIATKVGWSEGLSAREIERACDASLRRLGVERIDLYYAHKDDSATPLEETLAAFDRLVKAGKVRALGASQIEADRLAAALDIAAREGLTPYTVLQTWYNLVDRPRYEGALSALVAERGLGMTAFYGLANGYLTGKYRTEADLARSVRGERVAGHMAGNGPRVLAALDEVAAETGATPAAIALAWLTAQPAVTAAIASATSLAQLEDWLGALTLELSAAQLERLSAASA